MYFVLSKVLLVFIFPVIWVFALLLAALITKNTQRKKKLLILSVVLLYIISAPVFINLTAHAWSVDAPAVNKHKVYSCVIILGGFSSEGKHGEGYFNGSADRFIQGVMAYKTGRATHILVTSGNGSLFPNGFSEGRWVKTQLDSMRIPDSVILIEGNSRNTIENAAFSKPVLQKAGLKPPYLLITSDFHMRRSAMIFRKQGYDVDLYPANYTNGRDYPTLYDLVPDGNAISNWNIYLKEMVGYVVDRWK